MAKKKEDEGVDIFASAKSKTKSSSAKSDKTVVEVKGLEKKLLEHQWLSGEQANLKTQIDVVKNELKQIGLEKYVELYKKNKSNPNTFLLKDGEGCVMFMPTDGYIKIKEESRAEELIEKYGEDAVTIKEEYSFNNLYLERNLEAIKKLIKETKTISEEDKRNLIERTVEYSISKGTIDKLYQYGSKMASVLDDIQPIIALKNCGGKMEKGGSTDDLIGYVYEGSEDADDKKIIKKVDLYAKGSTIKGESNFGKEGSGFDNPKYKDMYKGTYDNRGLALKPTNDITTLGSKLVIEYDKIYNRFYWKLMKQNGTEHSRGVNFKTKQEAIDDYMTQKFAKGSTVKGKRKTEEEIYEEEQYNAMFNSEYGNGGGVGMKISARDFLNSLKEGDILTLREGGRKEKFIDLRLGKERQTPNGKSFRYENVNGGYPRGILNGDRLKYQNEQHSDFVALNGEPIYIYHNYENGGNMSSGYDYSIGGL